MNLVKSLVIGAVSVTVFIIVAKLIFKTGAKLPGIGGVSAKVESLAFEN